MQKKNPKTRCERRQLSKCKTVCRFYSKIQSAYVDVLQGNDEIIEFRCNVPLEVLEEGECFHNDYLIISTEYPLLMNAK